MSLKSKLFAGAAALTLAGGFGALMSTTPANAATPSCGRSCVEPYTQEFGPSFMADVLQQKAAVNQEIILYREADNDPALDFQAEEPTTVKNYYEAGLVSAAFALNYGNLEAFQIEYAPDGNDSGLCLGTWQGEVPVAGFKVRLEPCGVGPNTVWAVYSLNTDSNSNRHSSSNPAGNDYGYTNLLDAAGTNFSNPLAMTYPTNGYPTDSPRPWIDVEPLNGSTNPPAADNQQWSACLGAVGSSHFACAGAGLPGGI